MISSTFLVRDAEANVLTSMSLKACDLASVCRASRPT